MTLLLLGDSRFPAGGYAHSAGIEQAVDEEIVHDIPSLESFLEGRLSTTGATDAQAAAQARLLLDNLDGPAAGGDDRQLVREGVISLERELEA
ncbi:MAG TPA: hypothetical protein VMD59_16130, partial [Acidimicrobiales bacterium]|nr:hypothetical protein [Acidimicrobiales bacterium]